MKQYIIINEQLLKESLPDIDSEVDFIYNKYFKADIDDIQKTGIITPEMFPIYETDTSVLSSPDAKKAHELNPCKIEINSGKGNIYYPKLKLIRFGVHSDAVKLTLENGGNIRNVAKLLPYMQGNRFLKEFKDYRLRGTIHHELLHWIDDTFNNRHLLKATDKIEKLGQKNYLKGKTAGSSYIERQAQLGNIVQLKNEYADSWDELSFAEMVELSPSLNVVYNNMPKKEKIRWRRDIKTRMHREGLLGKNMINF